MSFERILKYGNSCIKPRRSTGCGDNKNRLTLIYSGQGTLLLLYVLLFFSLQFRCVSQIYVCILYKRIEGSLFFLYSVYFVHVISHFLRHFSIIYRVKSIKKFCRARFSPYIYYIHTRETNVTVFRLREQQKSYIFTLTSSYIKKKIFLHTTD